MAPPENLGILKAGIIFGVNKLPTKTKDLKEQFVQFHLILILIKVQLRPVVSSEYEEKG